MQIGLFEILGIVAAMQLFILSIFLYTHKKGNKLSNILLAIFLFGNGLIICDVILIHSNAFLKYPQFVFSGFSTTLLYGPLLYFYAVSVTNPEFKPHYRQLIHAFPFVMFWIFHITYFLTTSTQNKIEIVTSPNILNNPYTFGGYVLIHVQVVSYLALALKMIYYTKVKTSPAHNLNWLKLVLFGFTIMWTGDLILVLLYQVLPVPMALGNAFQFLAVLLYFLFVNYAVYKGLQLPEIFTGHGPKYLNSKLTTPERQSLVSRLEDHMKTNKPYLRSSVLIDEVANDIGVSSRLLSQAINETYEQNFIEFINFHRIRDAKDILQRSNDKKLTILEIMYQVGFNSKSAFNSAFKKHTGHTPTYFKNQ